MSPVRSVLTLLGTVVAFVVAGCGTPSSKNPAVSSPTSTPSPAAVSGTTLNGNWLLFGTMPTYFPSATVVTPGLAVSFNVEQGKVTGSASVQQACTSGVPFGWNFLGDLTGTVAADGSFSAAAPSSAGVSFTIKGTVPGADHTGWSGSYAFATTDPRASCAINLDGNFTAQPVPDVDGTFTGEGALTSFSGSGLVPQAGVVIGMTQTLHQGQYATTSSGASTYNAQRLGGTLEVSGIPCFSKGTSSTFFSNSLDGDEFETYWDMEDGSQASIWGTIEDPNASKLDVDFMVVSGGKCDGSYIFNPTPLVLGR